MAGALVAISALPASTTILSTDILPFVKSGTTDRITAGNLRAQMFGFAATDPLNCGILTAVGNSTITGTLGGISTLTATNATFTTLTVTTLNVPTIPGTTFTGDLLFTDATYDIGKSGATRPRDGFFSRNLTLTSGVMTAANVSAPAGSPLTFAITGFSNVWQFSTAGHFLAMADNTFDIGASGSRIRNLWMGNNFIGNAGGILFRDSTNGSTNASFADAGDVTVSRGRFVMSAAASKIIPGATSISHRNNADTLDNILILDNGNIAIRGAVTLATAASKIVPGATSLSLRNNADSADNLILTDAGAATIRSSLSAVGITSTAGAINATGAGAAFQVSSTQVVGARITGFTNAWTGAAADKATAYDASSVTLPQLGARVRALQEAIASSTGHGLIGP